MILTNCAVCATDLGLTLGKKCGRCSTRYCGPACQKQHWDGGHKDLCKKIKKAGGAEQYHANKKYTEAVAEAAEACADDTKGQTCYICTQALHWKTKEGLVRGCSCRGTAGFAHVSCLAEQAKILVADAEANNLNDKANEGWRRWFQCSLCEQRYHGVVICALGWACWKTYVCRPKTDPNHRSAYPLLSNGLLETGRKTEALAVFEARLAMQRSLGPRYCGTEEIVASEDGIATLYNSLGMYDEGLKMKRDIYARRVALHGDSHSASLEAATALVQSLVQVGKFLEAKNFLRELIPVARRVWGRESDQWLRQQWMYGNVLCEEGSAPTLDDLVEGVKVLEAVEKSWVRVMGARHPETPRMQNSLKKAQAKLAVAALEERISAFENS